MSVLIDANIFVYAYDPADLDKQEKALRLIEEVTHRGDLVLSVQVVNESLGLSFDEDQTSASDPRMSRRSSMRSSKARMLYR